MLEVVLVASELAFMMVCTNGRDGGCLFPHPFVVQVGPRMRELSRLGGAGGLLSVLCERVGPHLEQEALEHAMN